MKRWLVILLVVAALVLLVSPGIVGRLAEKNMQQSIDWAAAETPELLVQIESFDRGWFSSEGRHRVSLHGMSADADQLPSLIIETRVDHGPIPFTSISRDGGSLEPGLARARSTFQIESADGELHDLPGSALSRIGLNGESDIHYMLEPGSDQLDGSQFEWQGAEIFLKIDPNAGTAAVRGKIKPISASSQDGVASLGAIEFRGDQEITTYGFGIGSGELSTGEMVFSDAEGVSTGFQGLTLQGETGLDGDLVNGGYSMRIDGFAVPVVGDVAIQLAMSVADLDAVSVGKIYTTVNEAQASDDPTEAMAEIYPMIEQDVQTLLARGGSLNFDEFKITLPQGEIASVINVAIDESPNGSDFTWPAIALLTTASADISVPAMLVEMAMMMNPQAEQILNMGILVPNGDNFEMKAEYAQGLLTVNGAPFPIPLSGF